MKKIFNLFALCAMTVAMFSCNKEVNVLPETENEVSSTVATKSGLTVEKPLKIVTYVETNDANPLNAGDYFMSDETTPFVDIVELFAANIHKETVNGVVRPTLYLNDKLTPVLEDGGYLTYVKPLQDLGIKVVLTVLGDWQNIGVASMNSTQQQQFAAILAYAVNRYGLDGIGFDDEYYGTISTVSNSFGNIILYLRNLIGDDKLITVFDYGHTGSSQINSTAAAEIDYAYTDFSYWNTYSYISGMNSTPARWAPCSYNLSYSFNSTYQTYYAQLAVNNDYGVIMFFNLRENSVRDPLDDFQAISDGAFGGDEIVCVDGDQLRDAGSVSGGYTITYDDIQ